ncbi:MAG: MerR family transcriptional regulator [Gordonia sp. (in: high G+C Gram-positive bacteria)]
MEPDSTRLTMSQLSASTGVNPSTIKYYISLGLVPRGSLVASNRALYDAAHVQRIQLIRALVTVGGVKIARIQDIVAALEEESLTHVLAAVQDAESADSDDPPPQDDTIDLVRRGIGITVDSPLFHHPSVRRLASAMDACRPALGDDFPVWLDGLLAASRQAAVADVDLVGRATTPEDAARYAAVGIPLGDVIATHARRLWQSRLTTEAYGAGPVHRPEG